MPLDPAGGAGSSLLPPPSLPQAYANVISLAVALVLWWLSRRRRRRAPKAMGAKSRELIAAMVRTVRERSRPRPVLRPAPGGAR